MLICNFSTIADFKNWITTQTLPFLLLRLLYLLHFVKKLIFHLIFTGKMSAIPEQPGQRAMSKKA